MTAAGELRSGKGHRDENFPVASHLVHPRFRAPILAFYEFVRVADDIADHAELAPDKKLELLDRLDHEPRQMIGRQPIPQRRRHQERLVTVTIDEVLGHPRIPLNAPDGRTLRDSHRG